jgi:hypothetical protein
MVWAVALDRCHWGCYSFFTNLCVQMLLQQQCQPCYASSKHLLLGLWMTEYILVVKRAG